MLLASIASIRPNFTGHGMASEFATAASEPLDGGSGASSVAGDGQDGPSGGMRPAPSLTVVHSRKLRLTESIKYTASMEEGCSPSGPLKRPATARPRATAGTGAKPLPRSGARGAAAFAVCATLLAALLLMAAQRSSRCAHALA
jgi:hypothetical protein